MAQASHEAAQPVAADAPPTPEETLDALVADVRARMVEVQTNRNEASDLRGAAEAVNALIAHVAPNAVAPVPLPARQTVPVDPVDARLTAVEAEMAARRAPAEPVAAKADAPAEHKGAVPSSAHQPAHEEHKGR
jgi:hypothetical protein